MINKLKTLDLFAGAGGLSLGFHHAGFSPSFMIDNYAQSVETLEANFSHLGAQVLQKDLSKFTAHQFKNFLKKEGYDNDFDVIVGGPPCQGWSLVGRGKLRSLGVATTSLFNDPRNKLYKRFIQYVREFSPSVAVMENVPGMLSHSKLNVAEIVARNLEDSGYNVTWDLLNAVNYGVPQKRTRLIFIGVRKDLDTSFKMPETHFKNGKRRFPERTVRDAIRDLPVIRNGSQEWVRNYSNKRNSSDFAARMRSKVKPDKVFDHICRNQNDQDIEAFKIMMQGDWYRDLPKKYKRYRDDIFEDKYKKLYWDKPSWCVTAHLSKDCYTHIHPSQARTISIREAARLQSFPDHFYFGGSGMGHKFRLIGNAVPPLMAEAIAKEVKKQVFENRLRKL